MRLSDLQTKKVINITDGKNIGNIIDVYVTEDGHIELFVIETNKSIFSLNKETDIKIKWNNITKIGEDVMIAPLTFVNFDVPPHSIVIGSPAKIINKENATKGYIENKV